MGFDDEDKHHKEIGLTINELNGDQFKNRIRYTRHD